MKNTILVSAVTSFITVVLVLFFVHMGKGKGCHGSHGKHMQIERTMHHGGGHGYHGGGHGCKKGGDFAACHGKSKKGCSSKAKCDGSGKKKCADKKSCDKEVTVEKEVVIK